jgi:hypothetical protein
MAMRETRARANVLSRRDFGHRAALTLAGGALASAGMLSSGGAAGANGVDPGRPMTPPAPAGVPGLSPGARAEIEAKLRHIFARYGDRLSPKQRAKLHDVVTDHVRMLERIRAVQVHNSDPPAAVLKLLDGGGAGSKLPAR